MVFLYREIAKNVYQIYIEIPKQEFLKKFDLELTWQVFTLDFPYRELAWNVYQI